MQKQIILFYGPPGAGKGTQAEYIASKYGFPHFDTGKFLEKIIHDPSLQKNKIVQKQKKQFLSGGFVDPIWVGNKVKQYIKESSIQNKSIIMSGSPRTTAEAFEMKGGGVADAIIKHYGVENILIVFLDIPVAESVKRNSKRGRIGLDLPAVIKVRCREYKKRTLPVITEMKRRGIKIVKINGVATRSAISRAVLKEVKIFMQCKNQNPKSNQKKTSRFLKSRVAS